MNFIWKELRGSPAPARQKGAICLIVRGESREGEDDVLENLLNEFADDVRGGERGCISYIVTRMLGSPRHFAVHARFSSWMAFCRHGLTKHMNQALPHLNARLASPVSLEVFLEV